MAMLSFLIKNLTETMVNSHITLNRIIQQRQILNTVSKKMMETNTKDSGDNYTDEFRVLDLKKITTREKRPQRQRMKFEVPPPRTTLMKEDQDWTNVWPGPRTFHPAVVPLPIRQGHNKKKAAPGKYANAELMKIPNFLHLTPPAIEKHCKAIKKYCTQWPTGLETDDKCAQHFPVEVITSDYCHSSPTIRDPLARIVTIKFPLSKLPLDKHAKDKILRLLGNHYDEKSDLVTITTDRCPLRQQNYEYAMYLLTALFHESWRFESWEKEKSLDDMEYYEWETNQSYQNVISLLSQTYSDLDMNSLPEEWTHKLKEYKAAIELLFNNSRDEDVSKIDQYKAASIKLLF
uniref:Small ribosomal subunit protein mS35 mitochondrial conserved domain-containing protein n=1 Tax=Cuerna arida TaxID=1464854 RepID=A0A1B6EIQ9_9HEMI